MSRFLESVMGDRPYPETPGFKEPTTSAAAARAVTPEAGDLRAAVLREIAVAGPYGLTADEAAAKMGRSVLAIRPRVSELRETLKIINSGRMRKNKDSKKSAIVWILPRVRR